MNHFEATKILDRVAEGQDYPLEIINKALFLTGDIHGYEFDRMVGGDGSEGMDYAIQPKSNVDGFAWSKELVDGNSC